MKNELYPIGFEAMRGTDRRVFRFDSNPHCRGYRMSCYWIDDYTGKDRKGENLIFFSASTPKGAQNFIDKEKIRWKNAGWTIKNLDN